MATSQRNRDTSKAKEKYPPGPRSECIYQSRAALSTLVCTEMALLLAAGTVLTGPVRATIPKKSS